MTRPLALICALVATSAGTAYASGPSRSPLPGYPRFRGVILVRDGSAASRARERAIGAALKAATTNTTTPNCKEGQEEPGADLCWWGGPVLRAHKVHLIFWEGPGGTHAFPSGYIAAVENYFARVAAASGSGTNVYAVTSQYGDNSGAGEYKVTFSGTADVYKDIVDPLPAEGSTGTACEDTATEGQPCITDHDIQEEITRARVANGLEGGTWLATFEDVYFVFTPPRVGGCFYGHTEETAAKEGNACAFASGGYCAYHSSFESVEEEPTPPIYANIPDSGNVTGCDSFEHPNGFEGVDATLDTTSHEHAEIITDPLGGSWFDVIGQEVGDKCLPPETFDIYGEPLGGSLGEATLAKPGTAFNQAIDGHDYWLQREWSNTAFNGEGGCVQRMLPTSFTPPTEAKATVPATFDGSSSGEAEDPAVYWVWSFGDGMQTGTPEAKTTHTYARSGPYKVTLTAFDAYGNSNTTTRTVSVGNAPPSPAAPVSPAPVTNTITVMTPTPPVAKYAAARLAALLGLPRNGTRLAGLGKILLGHAECPPACEVTLRLYAMVPRRVHKRRVLRKALVGIAIVKGTPKGAVFVKAPGPGQRELIVSLNGKGRSLLRKRRRLPVALTVLVEGQEGGTWTIQRRITLTR